MLIRRHSPITDDYARASCDARPQHILEKIVWHKEQEIAQMQAQLPSTVLRNQLSQAPPIRDFILALKQCPLKPSLIAEVKQASPSRGIIRADFDAIDIALTYQRSGAACLSVLCDRTFFGGSFDNLLSIRERVSLPLLCKEFIIDPHQIYLARASGADAVLLIAAILCDRDLQNLIDLTHDLGMEALIEVHDQLECDRVLALSGIRLLGINNRNLEDFTVELNTTEQLIGEYGESFKQRGITAVSESGILTPGDLERVTQTGVAAILVGEGLIKHPDLEQALTNLYRHQFSTVGTHHSVS